MQAKHSYKYRKISLGSGKIVVETDSDQAEKAIKESVKREASQ